MIKESCIYNGKVIHKRFKPKKHFFSYKVFSLLIDLDEINNIDKKIIFFSHNKFNLISFYDKDHGDRNNTNLKDWVLKNLKSININDQNIKIKVLCYPRILGYVFNPLSIFFVYNLNSSLIAIMYEVKNTFGEQHTYVFKANSVNKNIKNNCTKKFYVSPFMDLNSRYFFRITNPGENLSVLINQKDKDGKLLFASQDGSRIDLNTKNLIFSYLKHPLMTFKVILAIHFEALRLWLKGIKLVSKKIKIKNNISIEKK